ncbi:MAG: acyl-CoA thioesterase [Candidatus Omnitrophica bacterium]|nr:acyl-CoA thioesterase [Candidatus Omnitrophota bacterium]
MPIEGKKVSESRTETSYLMMPQHANPAGKIYGGTILSMADAVAYMCAARHSTPNCVTVALDQVDFREPINIGEAVTFKASVNYVGHTSMEIGIRIEAEDLKTGKRRHTNSCYFTMVALDEKGRPAPVPPLITKTPDERRRFQEGRIRRDHSKELSAKRQAWNDTGGK